MLAAGGIYIQNTGGNVVDPYFFRVPNYPDECLFPLFRVSYCM